MSEIENREIELRSNEVKEILSRPPKWILQYGIVLIFIVLIGLLAGSWFFRYPEILTAPIVVTTENLPFNIIAKTSNRIDTLMVGEKEEVRKNQLLGVLENSANSADILLLERQLDSISLSLSYNQYHIFDGKNMLKLGELQSVYATFVKAYEDLSFFLRTDYHSKKIRTIGQQKAIQQKIMSQSNRALQISTKQLEAAHNQFKIDSSLFVKKTMSAFEFEASKNSYLQVQQAYENANTAIENQKLSLLQLDQQIFDLQQQKKEQSSQLELAYNSALDALRAQLTMFKQNYFLVSQIDGLATFTKYYQTNQNVVAGETIMTIVPNEKQKIVGKIYLPPRGAGKVKVGQRVNVKLDDFPYNEYGMLQVKIKNISLVPVVENKQNSYVLEVEFPDSLKTTYRKTIEFRQQMSGQAEIITDDTRLLERLLNPIRAVFDK